MTLKEYLREYWEDCRERFDYSNSRKFLAGALISVLLTAGGCMGIKTLIDNSGKQNRNYLERKVYGPDKKEQIIYEAFMKDTKETSHQNYKNRIKDFPKNELDIIYKTADRVGINPALLMAIRKHENGKVYYFGVMPGNSRYKEDKGIIENGNFKYYKNRFEKQCNWSAITIKKNFERYLKSDKKYDFISFMQKEYCPIGAENDPRGLNKYWEGNVKKYFQRYKIDSNSLSSL